MNFHTISIRTFTILLTVLWASTASYTYAQDLYIDLAASSSAVGAGDALDYTLMASNTGSTTLENVLVEIRLPQQIATFFTGDLVGDDLNCGNTSCSPDETIAWQIGTLEPGENRRTSYPTRIANSPATGDAETVIVASADEISDIIFTNVVVVDPSPLMRLSLVPGPGPAVPGEPFTYTITYGNIGSTNPDGVLLTMPIPEGTSFLSATEGGSENEGVVTWSLGTVGVGAGGRAEVTVIPDTGLMQGEALSAEASIDSGIESELIVSSASLTEVGMAEELQFNLDLSQNAVSPSGVFTYTLTAANTGSVDLLNATAQIRLPQQINTFFTSGIVGEGLNCGNTSCSSEETITWPIGTLAPGQSRTVVIRSYIAGNAQQGEVLRLFYHATADGLNKQTGGVDIVVDPSPVTSLRLIPGPGPAVPGEPFTYTILFSNIGFQPADVALTVTLPEEVSFISATSGGTESNGTVSWQISDVAEESLGRVKVTVEPPLLLPAGSILKAKAELNTGSTTEYTVFTEAAVPILEDQPLFIDYTSDLEDGRPGDPFRFTMYAENTGASDLTDVRANFRLPSQIARFTTGDVIGNGLNCGNTTCGADETVSWEVGILAPGQSRTIIMPTSIASNVSEGTFMLSPVVASATGSNELTLYNDILLGTPVNFPPSAAVIISPANDTTIVIGATDGEGPIPAETPFMVEWSASDDSENDALTYTWQLSASTDFNDLLIDSPGSENGTATRFETDFGTLAALLESNGVQIGESLRLYHRVATSDGTNETLSNAFSIVFERGTVTNLERKTALPKIFALHSNYPNPFNPTTTFRFDLPELAEVSLIVYDAVGRKVATVVSERLPAGQFQYSWDAGHLSSGVYLYRLQAGSFIKTNKLVLLK